jgi:hypothetical protein
MTGAGECADPMCFDLAGTTPVRVHDLHRGRPHSRPSPSAHRSPRQAKDPQNPPDQLGLYANFVGHGYRAFPGA